MGKKYIIEVADDSFYDDLSTKCWRVKGIDGLILDEDDLSNLEEYEPEKHKFVVGDVCKFTNAGSYFVITRITPDYISYMWNDGSHGGLSRSIFEDRALFIRHSDEFYSVINGGF